MRRRGAGEAQEVERGHFMAIVSRALGLNSGFVEARCRLLTPNFIKNYYRFADQMLAVQYHALPIDL